MTLPTSGTITARQIADTLGYTLGANGTRIGDYRLDGGQKFVGGTPQQPTEITLPIANGIPITGPISFSDFYGARPTYVVDYYSGAAEIPSDDAHTRFINGTKVIIGSLIGPKDDANDTSGRRVIILVNKDIGSDTRTATHCALKTGSGWSPDTQLEILVGPHGEIIGAGGLGGGGGSGGSNPAGSGSNGSSGSSALGIQYEGTGRTRVIVQNLGKIAGGGGGGGGGGGARCEREEAWAGPEVGGNGGTGGNGTGYNQSSTNGGSGTTGAVYGGGNAIATGGSGGNGGNFGAGGGSGVDGTTSGYLEWSSRGEGGAGGGAGAAIRKTNSSINVNVSTQGALSQIAGAVDALGIT